MGAYSKIVWEHFNEPRNVGQVVDADLEGHAGGRRGGPFMHFSARVRTEIIEEIRFQTYGCAPAIAAGSVLTAALKGKALQDAWFWDEEKLLEELGGLPDDKRHCARLAIDALRDLIASAGRRAGPESEGSFLDGRPAG